MLITKYVSLFAGQLSVNLIKITNMHTTKKTDIDLTTQRKERKAEQTQITFIFSYFSYLSI